MVFEDVKKKIVDDVLISRFMEKLVLLIMKVMKMKKKEKEEDEKTLCLWFIVRYNGLVQWRSPKIYGAWTKFLS